MFSLATAITNAHCGISVGLARRCDIVLAKSHFAGKMLQRFRNILERKTKTIKEEFSPPPPQCHTWCFPPPWGRRQGSGNDFPTTMKHLWLPVHHERALPTFYIILLFSVSFCHLLQNEAAMYFFKSSIIGVPANRNPLVLAGLLVKSVGGWEPPRSGVLVKCLKRRIIVKKLYVLK